MLDRLAAKGFIRRERRGSDRRVMYLRMTSSGRAALSRMNDSAAQAIRQLFRGFSAIEVEVLERHLTRLIQNGQALHREDEVDGEQLHQDSTACEIYD